MSKNKKLFIILLAVVIGLVVIVSVACSALGNVASEMNNILMGGTPAQEVMTRDLSNVIYSSGVIESQHRVSITTELTGQVKELHVQLGDYVTTGQALLVMDDSEIRTQITELEKQISDQKKLENKEKEINQRNLTYAKEEQTQLLAEAQKLIDAAQTEEEKAEAQKNYNEVLRTTNQQIQAAQDTIDTQGIGSSNDNTASTKLTELRNQLEKTTIYAPQSGIVTSLNISIGSMVSTSDLMIIEDNKNLKLTVSIPETDILKISQGMSANIEAAALEDVQIPGKVNKIINFATSTDSSMGPMEGGPVTGSYSAEVLIEGETQLLLGMNAKAEIIVSEKKDALSVAYDSILKEDDGKAYVYLATETEETSGDAPLYSISKVPVTIGDEGDYYTEIISDEIKEGDIIISYPDTVAEGDKISLEVEISEE